MRNRLLVLFLAIGLLLPSLAFGQKVQISSAERKAADEITAAQISSYLHFIASDAMAGRDTPSVGLDITAEFIRMNLERWGLKGAGDNGSFFQKMALVRDIPDPENTKLEIGGRNFVVGTDFARTAGSGSVSGPLVFGGNGWFIKSKGIDALAGVDVKGKIVVIGASTGRAPTGLPAGITPQELTGQRGVDWADPVSNAERLGAVGIIVLGGPQTNFNAARPGGRGPGYSVEKLRSGSTMPVVIVTPSVADIMFSGESGDRNGTTAFALSKTATVNAAVKRETAWTQNVVALWEGSDPVLKNEMVAVGAHYDHVGTNPNVQGDDKIFNGADDDGSGTVAVLSIAEALARSKTRPKRSILFVWHAGEEKGLWGADYFNKFPTVNIKNVVAQLNIDMIGRSKKPGDTNPANKDLTGEHAIYVIGKDMMSSTLGSIVAETNNAFQKLEYDLRYDDPKDTNRFFFRSDHFHYAQNGIPIAFWFDGVHEDYHRPGDHADKIDYQKMEKVTRTIFLTMLELADLKERPKVDKQLPPELTQR